MTRTYAILEVSPAVYAEVRAKMLPQQADYGAIREHPDGEIIDMDGIALRMVSGASTPVRDLDLDVRCLNVLHLLRATTAGEVALLGRQKLWRARQMGKQSLARIERALATVGLTLAP